VIIPIRFIILRSSQNRVTLDTAKLSMAIEFWPPTCFSAMSHLFMAGIDEPDRSFNARRHSWTRAMVVMFTSYSFSEHGIWIFCRCYQRVSYFCEQSIWSNSQSRRFFDIYLYIHVESICCVEPDCNTRTDKAVLLKSRNTRIGKEGFSCSPIYFQIEFAKSSR